MALVARPEQLPRVGACAQLRTYEHAGVVKLLEAGPVTWPDGAQRFAMVYETPAGPPLLRKGKRIEPMDARLLARMFVIPAAQVLTEYNRRGVAHRAIRPDNVFWYDYGKTRLTLGPATVGPAGAMQPAVCETLEMAICDSYGKGLGTPGDDLFSLGVTVLALLRGEWPLADLTDEQILDKRIELGSWDALAGKYNPPTEMYDLLRGLLCDDPNERWSLATLAKWAEGSRPQLPRFTMPPKAREPFLFEGKLLRTGREIAIAMGKNPQPAAAILRTGLLRDWARRALPDDIASRKLDTMSGPGSPAARDGDGPLVARACMALDPTGPLRVAGYAFRPDGIAAALGRAFTADRQMLPAIDAAIRAGLHLEWADAQKAANPNQKSTTRRINAFERLGRWANEPVVGAGLGAAFTNSTRACRACRRSASMAGSKRPAICCPRSIARWRIKTAPIAASTGMCPPSLPRAFRPTRTRCGAWPAGRRTRKRALRRCACSPNCRKPISSARCPISRANAPGWCGPRSNVISASRRRS